MLSWLKERHEFWWNHLLENMPHPGITTTAPKILYETRLSSVAARANTYWCKYNLHYLFNEGNDYDETIAHEVCHTFVNRVEVGMPQTGRTGSHNILWFYAYNVVCGIDRGATHSYDVKSSPMVEQVKEFLKLKEALKDR